MKIENRYNMPQSIVNAVSKDTYQGPKNELNRISVSTIKDSPRIHYLKCRHWDELKEDASDRLWSLLGTAIHHIVERAEDKQTITEERVEIELDGVIISGQMDVLGEHRIEDYKCTSTWTIIYNPKGKLEWVQQLNIYAWLASKKGFDIKELVINAILRDHQSSKAKLDKTYPQIPFISINLPIWSLEATESYLKGRIALFKSCANLSDSELPECTKEEVWAKDSTWALMKDGGKRAVRVYDTREEAEKNKTEETTIVERPGSWNRCEQYCPVKAYCNQFLNHLEVTK